MTENNEINNNIDAASNPPQLIEYAGFWMRFWAYLLDIIIIFSINGMLVKPIFRAAGIPLVKTGLLSPYPIVAAIVFYAYFILMTKFAQQTIGKMVFGLKVTALEGNHLSWGTIIFREGVGRYISATFTILYAIIAFTPKKQGLHDIFADTTVVHDRVKHLEPANM